MQVAADVEDVGDIEMQRGAVVSGQVQDLQGNPVSETLVLLTPLEYQDASELFVQGFLLPIRISVMTDMDGRFELPPAFGKCSVLLAPFARTFDGVNMRAADSPPIVMPQLVDLSSVEPEVELKIVEAETATISGHIRFEDGSPAQHVTLQGSISGPDWGGILGYAFSDENG